MSDPFHPHPHGQEGTQPAQADPQISRILDDVNGLKLWRDSLRGQDGIEVDKNVIRYRPGNSVQQTVILTLCVNGAPGYVVVPAESPPATF